MADDENETDIPGDRMAVGTGVTLVGGGPVARDDLRRALAHAPCLVAADGGAEHVLAAGLLPDRVIGDMDSISAASRDRLASRLWPVGEQDSTDFEKCLARIDAPLILGLGFTGGRMDHALAALSVLARYGGPRLLIGAEDVVFAAPAKAALDLAPGTRVSLFPMCEITGRSRGLEWPIDGLSFAPGGRAGTSNRATGRVTLAFDGPGMLVLLPRDCLAAALSALGG